MARKRVASRERLRHMKLENSLAVFQLLGTWVYHGDPTHRKLDWGQFVVRMMRQLMRLKIESRLIYSPFRMKDWRSEDPVECAMTDIATKDHVMNWRHKSRWKFNGECKATKANAINEAGTPKQGQGSCELISCWYTYTTWSITIELAVAFCRSFTNTTYLPSLCPSTWSSAWQCTEQQHHTPVCKTANTSIQDKVAINLRVYLCCPRKWVVR